MTKAKNNTTTQAAAQTPIQPETVSEKKTNRGFFDINDSTLLGRLTAEPQIRLTDSGAPVCNLTLAVNSGSGNYERTDFIPVRLWGKQGEWAADNLHKGDALLVKGSFAVDQWEKDDEHKYFSYVLARLVRPVGYAKSSFPDQG